VNHVKVVALATLLFLALGGRLFGQDCESLRSASPDDLVSFLDANPPDEANAECLTFAIHKLGEKRYEPAIPVLARLLDFRRPLNEREKRGLYLHIQGIPEIYPAANALEEIGASALPTVLEVIKAGSASTTARENAVSVWMEIYKYESPKGVARLKQEADKTNDAAKQNLKWALSKALTWCNPPDEAQCKAAAKTGRGDH
jgi:hypothetical protein